MDNTTLLPKALPKIVTVDHLGILEAMPRLYIDSEGGQTRKSMPQAIGEIQAPKWFKEQKVANPLSGTDYKRDDNEKLLQKLDKEREEMLMPALELPPPAVVRPKRARVLSERVERPQREVKKPRVFEEEEDDKPSGEIVRVVKMRVELEKGRTWYTVAFANNRKREMLAKTVFANKAGDLVARFHAKTKGVEIPADVRALMGKK